MISNLLMMGNVAFALAYMLVAYSPYIHPAVHPMESCLGMAFPIFMAINGGFLVFWLLVRWRYALLPLLTFLFSFGAIRTYLPMNYRTKDIPEGAIKLLSYNCMMFGGLELTDGENDVLNYLKSSEADIICLQEYGEGVGGQLKVKQINSTLKAYKYRDIHKLKNGYNRIALFSKYPIISKHLVDYESLCNGSVQYRLLVGADTLLLINNHLESNKLTQQDKEIYNEMLTEHDREKVETGARYLLGKLSEASAIRSHQADTIAAIVARADEKYIVVCGDFNDTPISYARRKISERLDDAFVKTGSGLGISYNRNRFYFRIDHILTSHSVTAYNCTVDRTIKASDHYPIWCYLTLNKEDN
jgi:exonuclease III